MEMGEAKRRHRDDEPTVIKGPFSYEICLFGLDQIMAGGLIELLSDGPPSPRGVTIIKATANLAARMRDPGRPKMLCMSYDHEFARAGTRRRSPWPCHGRASSIRISSARYAPLARRPTTRPRLLTSRSSGPRSCLRGRPSSIRRGAREYPITGELQMILTTGQEKSACRAVGGIFPPRRLFRPGAGRRCRSRPTTPNKQC
jgi:hypothetical protein